MDLRTLTVFVKVGERRSFVRAAAELGMGQSGVSNAITRLEDELGVQLLARTTRSVNLTEDGAAFLQRCRQILADIDEARQVLGEARLQATGRLRIDYRSRSAASRSSRYSVRSAPHIRRSDSSLPLPTATSI